MTAPLNLPDDPNQRLTMDGFVADYISAFTAEMGKQPNLGAVRPDHEGLHPSRCRFYRRARPQLVAQPLMQRAELRLSHPTRRGSGRRTRRGPADPVLVPRMLVM